ncbi:MAG: monofunctional biosynthetic peptidoglycan transglycosylase, partial [Bdellovibrionota bacterium]
MIKFLGTLRKLIFRLILLGVASTVLLVVAYRWMPVPVTSLMVLRVVENLIEGKPVRLEKVWVESSKISPRVRQAIVASEDFKFFEHSGFDWVAIEKAMKHNKRKGRIHGGSTISQQTAKNVFLWPARSWVRKGFEAYFTGLIEFFWTKDRIMEVYLNVVELGDGVYGVEAASRTFFKKSASELTMNEAALLAAVLPNPRLLLVDRPSSYVRFRQSMIRRRMPAAARVMPAALEPTKAPDLGRESKR